MKLKFSDFLLQNLSFVKDINVAGNKMIRNDDLMTNSKSCIFFNRSDLMFAKIRTYSFEFVDENITSSKKEVGGGQKKDSFC